MLAYREGGGRGSGVGGRLWMRTHRTKGHFRDGWGKIRANIITRINK